MAPQPPSYVPTTTIPGYVPTTTIPGYVPVGVAPVSPVNSGLAVVSLLLGILGVFTAGIAGLPAVICGHIALNQINRADGRLKGKGIATIGLILGYIGIVVGIGALIANAAGQ
jgi:hypothetical protein